MVNNAYTFPAQKLESNLKTRRWAKDSMNYIIGDFSQEFSADISRMLSSYKMINSQLDEDDYRSICHTLGVSYKYGKRYIHMYNKAHNIYATLKGEEANRPFTFDVVNMSPDSINEQKRTEEIEYRRYMISFFKKEMEKLRRQIEIEVAAQAQELSPDQVRKEIQNIEKQVEEQYADVLDMEAIKKRFKDKFSVKERTLNKLLRIALHKQKFKWLKNETFGDAIATGKEIVEVMIDPNVGLPIIRQLNPINVFYHKSPDTPFLHESDCVGYAEELTIGQVLDLYGDRMTDKDLERLQAMSYGSNSVYGTTDSLFHGPGDRHASSWAAVRDSGMYPSGRSIDPYGLMIQDGKVVGIPQSGSGHGNNVRGPGLYADERGYRNNFATVYTVYWRSFRKLYWYEYEDDYGKMTFEIAPEDFVVPKNAKTETYKRTKFGRNRKRKIWYDKEGRYNSLEEVWLTEIWKGKRINGDIFVDVGPLEHAYQSLLNPYKVKIPIYGFIYNSRNTGNLSVVDRMKPWQKLYYVVMSKLIRSLAQEKGVFTFLNSLMIDEEIGLKKTLELAEDSGIIPYNPLAYSKGGNFVNTLKVAETVDATNAKQIEHYINLLQFIETQMTETVGMSAQRMAQTKTYTTATDNQRDTAHSMNITESMFYGHDMLWEDILQGYMEMTVSALNESTGKIKGLLDDSEVAVLDIGLISMEDEYLLKVGNNLKANRILEQGYQLGLTLLQNDKANLSTLIDLMKTEDLSEFSKELKEVEEEIQKREDRLQEMQDKRERDALEVQRQMREDEQKARLDETYLRGVMDQEKEHIRGRYMMSSFGLQHDKDKDGIPDLIEADQKYQEFLARVGSEDYKNSQKDVELDLRAQELDQRRKEHEDSVSLQKEQTASKERIEDKKVKASEEKSKSKT